jgi:hypothetical protein
MTKQQEIEILRATAAKLGADSYLGPWLSFVIPIVERDIRSDNPPVTLTPKEHAAQIIAEAEDVLRRAKSDAEITRQQAVRQLMDAKQIRLSATQAVAQANRDLEKLIRSLA